VWQQSRDIKAEREAETKEQKRKRRALAADMRNKSRRRYRNAMWDSKKATVLGQMVEVIEKHTPGGQQHDQTSHGSWSQGSAPDTSSSGGGGATLAQQPSPAASEASPVQQAPSSPDERRSGGRASRPKTLDALSGQNRVRERLGIMVDAAKSRGDRLDHVMFSGPPGLGKTTMAKALANEMGTNMRVVTGPALKDRKALIDILNQMDDGDILFIDEIHALPRGVEDTMLPLLEDGEIDVNVDGTVVRAQAPDITIVGATTNPEGVVKPLRDRFGAQERLQYYTPNDMKGLVQRTASKLGMELPDEAATLLTSRSRGTPRIANKLVRRLNDYIAAGRADGPSLEAVDSLMRLSEIDPGGLTTDDRVVLTALRDGGTMGVNALAAATGRDQTTIASEVEPYLMRAGFITRTGQGRSLTDAGRYHIEQYENYGRDDIQKRGEQVFETSVSIAKSDNRKNLVFGWANVTLNEDGTELFDHQGHAIGLDTLEDAAYNFAVKYRKTGDMHKGDGYGDLVESVVVTKDKVDAGVFPEEHLGKWWIGFKVPDEDWDRVQSGERSMFSIQGRAQLEAV
jgi:Holliday junction DNA helicase RuvB